MSPAGFEHTPGTPWQVNQRSRQLDHITYISSVVEVSFYIYSLTVSLQYPDLRIQMDMWQYMYEISYGMIANAKSIYLLKSTLG